MLYQQVVADQYWWPSRLVSPSRPPHTTPSNNQPHTALNIQRQISKVKIISEVNRVASPPIVASKGPYRCPVAKMRARADPDRAIDTVGRSRGTGELELTTAIRIAIIVRNSHRSASLGRQSPASRLGLIWQLRIKRWCSLRKGRNLVETNKRPINKLSVLSLIVKKLPRN